MPSSRWKRFAFFDRHTLNLPSEVLQDLIPFGDGGKSRSSSTSSEGISLASTIAALPLSTKPLISEVDAGEAADNSSFAVTGMWSSLAACAALDTPSSDEDGTILLPSQGQIAEGILDRAEDGASALAVDGLVLVFVTSKETGYVHCFDVTVRCNPNESVAVNSSDRDGWRGYFAPFKGKQQAGTNGNNQRRGASAADEIISEHMAPPEPLEGIVSIATCRGKSGHKPLYMACVTTTKIMVCVDPHLHLSCRRPLADPRKLEAPIFVLQSPWNAEKDGKILIVDIQAGLVAVGTDMGSVHVFSYGEPKRLLKPHVVIPPPATQSLAVVSVKLSRKEEKDYVFVAYRRASTAASPRSDSGGVCCYEMPVPVAGAGQKLASPSARHDLDGRPVLSSSLCDASTTTDASTLFAVARSDGLYTYSVKQKVDVAPIDGDKLAICAIPPASTIGKPRRALPGKSTGPSYSLVASMDAKSQRDAVDIYDSSNKLVAFHFLLSPGHRAVRAAGVTTPASRKPDGSFRGGRSSAILLTSGGSLVTLTEKQTKEKVALLEQKNLYSAAILVAYADQSFENSKITDLYRRHAEHLYRKGDYNAAIDQYIHTIGSLEPSHVIFRYLDAPKIPLLVKYLEELRSRKIATPVHNELLRTCYLKLNDTENAESITAFSSRAIDADSLSSLVNSNPKEALATICSFEASQAAEALSTYGASLARVMPRETAGVVVSLCLGTFSPKKMSEAYATIATDSKKMLEFSSATSKSMSCDQYPVQLFSSAFLEHPKILRLILSHCNKNKCPLTPSLRRTLLDLTLAELSQAKRQGDTETEKLRRKEAIAALTDTHSQEIGDYDALVIVQQAGFEEGELLLYERLQMGPMLLERYAKDGGEKARRQMLVMARNDPEILAEVLGHFVSMVSRDLTEKEQPTEETSDEDSEAEADEVLDDIQEALSLARRQGVLAPVRIARILAGEGTGQFSSEQATVSDQQTVPLSVALDYVGSVLDESRKDITRLKSEVDEYNQLCNSMEEEVESLRRASMSLPPAAKGNMDYGAKVEELYSKVRQSIEDADQMIATNDLSREAFWREMDHTEDSFDTIARFFAKGVIQ